MCKKIDESIIIDKNNRRRLENYLNRKNKDIREPKLLYNNVYFVGLTTDRNVLYERINARAEDMISDGLIEEVKYLLNKYGKTRISIKY